MRSPAQGSVTLEILDQGGRVVRRYSSDDLPEPLVEGRNIPDYWIRPWQALPAQPGMHRFVWDLHYAPPAVLQFSYPIAAISRNTPRVPKGPWVLPGQYIVRLTIGGNSYTQPLTVKMDPRVKMSPEELATQHATAMTLYSALGQDDEALQEVRAVRRQLAGVRERGVRGRLLESVTALDQKAAAFDSGDGGFARLNGQLASLLNIVEGIDAPPTTQVDNAVAEAQRALDERLGRWRSLKEQEVAALNDQLRQANLPPIVLSPPARR